MSPSAFPPAASPDPLGPAELQEIVEGTTDSRSVPLHDGFETLRREIMLPTDEIRTAFNRNRRAVELRPSVGQGTAVTRVVVDQGLTCHIQDGRWQLTAGMSEKSGGAGAGPDPGVFGRAALGSCLAVGYVMWAAKAGIPLSSVHVEIRADYDVRGEYGVDEIDPSYAQIVYVVTVESDAPEMDVLRVLDEADSHSPYLAIFRNPQDVRRELRIVNSGE